MDESTEVWGLEGSQRGLGMKGTAGCQNHFCRDERSRDVGSTGGVAWLGQGCREASEGMGGGQMSQPQEGRSRRRL